MPNYDFLGSRVSGNRGVKEAMRDGRGGSSNTQKSSRGDVLEIQDSLNAIADNIADCYEDAAKIVARFAVNENKNGNTSLQSMEKKINQFLRNFSEDAKVEILTKALSRTIANI